MQFSNFVKYKSAGLELDKGFTWDELQRVITDELNSHKQDNQRLLKLLSEKN